MHDKFVNRPVSFINRFSFTKIDDLCYFMRKKA